jgi:hypothetical protein
MSENKVYPETKSKSTPIKIAKGLDRAIELFLKTEKAKLLGYRYKSDVVNDAVRQLLISFGFLESVEENA